MGVGVGVGVKVEVDMDLWMDVERSREGRSAGCEKPVVEECNVGEWERSGFPC